MFAYARYRLVSGLVSTPGRREGMNQDYAVQHIPSDASVLASKGALFVVADGLSAHQAGQIASQLAARTFVNAYYRDPKNDLPWSLERAAQIANSAVWHQARRFSAYRDMGTTLVAVAVCGNRMYIANVGDSRAYLARGGRLWRITHDHSYVAELIRRGSLSPARALQHPMRKLLSRVVGHAATVAVDLFQGEIAPGDVLFLCSDGLSDWMTERAILDILVQAYDPGFAARTLTMRAFQHGSDDNITSLIVRAIPLRQHAGSSISARQMNRSVDAQIGHPRAGSVSPGMMNTVVGHLLGVGLVFSFSVVALLILARLIGS